jgi:hypothetical protein
LGVQCRRFESHHPDHSSFYVDSSSYYVGRARASTPDLLDIGSGALRHCTPKGAFMRKRSLLSVALALIGLTAASSATATAKESAARGVLARNVLITDQVVELSADLDGKSFRVVFVDMQNNKGAVDFVSRAGRHAYDPRVDSAWGGELAVVAVQGLPAAAQGSIRPSRTKSISSWLPRSLPRAARTPCGAPRSLVGAGIMRCCCSSRFCCGRSGATAFDWTASRLTRGPDRRGCYGRDSFASGV